MGYYLESSVIFHIIVARTKPMWTQTNFVYNDTDVGNHLKVHKRVVRLQYIHLSFIIFGIISSLLTADIYVYPLFVTLLSITSIIYKISILLWYLGNTMLTRLSALICIEAHNGQFLHKLHGMAQ